MAVIQRPITATALEEKAIEASHAVGVSQSEAVARPTAEAVLVTG